MTREELKGEIARLRECYGKDKLPMPQERFDLWYELVADYDAKAYHRAVTEYMRDSEYAPLPGSIYKKYASIMEEKRKAENDVKQEWTNAVSSYSIRGGNVRDEDFKVFCEVVIGEKPVDEWWKAASEFFTTVLDYATEHDGEEFPPFDEFIRGLK